MLTLIVVIVGILALVTGLELTLRRRALREQGGWLTRALPPVDPTAVRIVVLGDSIAYGPDLKEEQTWPALLAQRLHSEYPERRWQVINAGVSGNTVADAYSRFGPHVRAYQPHLVILALGLNDCRQVYRAIDRRRQTAFVRNELTWWEKSYLLRGVMNRLAPLPAVDYTQAPDASKPRTPPDLFDAALRWFVHASRGMGAQPVLLTMTPVNPPASRQEEFAHWAAYNEAIRSIARREGIPLIEVSHPFRQPSPWADDGVHLSAQGEITVAERVWQGLHRPNLASVLQIPTTRPTNAEMAPSLD